MVVGGDQVGGGVSINKVKDHSSLRKIKNSLTTNS